MSYGLLVFLPYLLANESRIRDIGKKLSEIEYKLKQPSFVTVYREGEYAVLIDDKTKEVLAKSTDQHRVMQKAIDETSAVGGGIVRVKKVIEIDDYLIPKRNVALVGAGDYSEGSDTPYGDVICAKSSMEALFITDEYVENFRIAGLALDGNDLAQKAFKHTQGSRIKLVAVEICRVLDKGIESTVSGELQVVMSRVSASKSGSASASTGIELGYDSMALMNTVRAFKTGIKVRGGANHIISNHPYSVWRDMEVGIDVKNDIVIGNYVDNYHVAGIRIREWSNQVIGNKIVTAGGLGTVDAPFILINPDTAGLIGAEIIVANAGAPRSGTTVEYAVKFGDNVTDAIEIYEANNRWSGYNNLTNNERLLASASIRIPILSDCANIRSGSHKGEITICYDSATATWKLKVWDGSAWQAIG